MTTVPSGRQEVVGEVGDHRPPFARIGDRPERRQEPGVVERVLGGTGPAQDVDEGEGHDGAGRDGPGAAGRDDEVGRWPIGPARRCVGQPAERRPRRRHPQAHAVAGRVGPRRDPQLAHPVAQAMAVGAPVRPAPDAVDRPRRRARRARALRPGRPRCPTPAAPFPAAGQAAIAAPRVVADLDHVHAAVEDLGQGQGARAQRPPGVVWRQRQLEQEVGAAAPPGSPRSPRPGRAATSPARSAGSPKTPIWSAIAPARTTVRSGRRDAAAATTRRQLADPAPLVGRRRLARADQDRGDVGSSSSADIASGSIDLGARRRRSRQPAPRGGRHERLASERSEAATTARRRGGWLRDREPRQVADAAPAADPERVGELRVGADRTFGEDGDDRVRVGARRQHERPDEPPATTRRGR